MVVTNNVECTSLYRNNEGIILFGESPQCSARYQIPHKVFHATAETASEPHTVLDNISGSSEQLRTLDEEKSYSGEGIRSRANTFSDSLPSTSSDFSRTPCSEAIASPSQSGMPNIKHARITSTSSSQNLEMEVDGDEELENEELEEDRLAEAAAEEGASGSSHIEKRHKCDICGKAFPYMSILESHKRCHTGEKPFSCHFCDKKFAQKATLQVHERTHTGERPYKCKYCEKTFAQYGTKTVHEKSAHLGIRNYKCPKCNKFLSSPSALYTHKKTHGDKSFQCAFCPKQFTLKNYLKLHIKQVHEHGERKHVCKFCSKTFAYAGSLQVHVRTHTGERPYICKFCPKAFASQGNLQSHERTHTGERPYICRYCGRSFIQKSQLTAHEATHTYGDCMSDKTDSLHDEELGEFRADGYMPEQNNNNMNCIDLHQNTINGSTQIDSQFEMFGDSEIGNLPSSAETNSASPDNHSQTSGKERRQSDFVCKFCGKRYAYASSLYVHTRLHTGERPFRCNFCDKSFTNQGNMQVHLRVHTGEKPYKCDACGKCYAQKVGLKIHQEQCQVYLNRRGSVVTVDSESSPPSAGSIDSAEGVVSESERAFIERLLFEEKQHIASLNANQFGQSTRFDQTNNLPNVNDVKALPQATSIAHLVELRGELGSIGQHTVGDGAFRPEINIYPANTISTPILPINNNVVSPSNLTNYLSTLSSSVLLNPPLLNIPTTATEPLISSATGSTISSAIDFLMRPQAQSNATAQSQPLANLLFELEQRQLLLQHQQRQVQQLSPLHNLFELPASNANAPNIGNILSLSDVAKLVQSQPTVTCNEHSSTSSLVIAQPPPVYTQLQTRPHDELLQLSQQFPQQQSQQYDTQRILEQILQLRAIEQRQLQLQQQQQQQSILASIQQVLPSLLNGNAAVVDCNNNNAAATDNNHINPLMAAISVDHSVMAPTIAMTSAQPVVAPYSQNFASVSGTNGDSAYVVPKEPIFSPAYPLNSDVISNEKRNLVIAAAEALQSLSKQQCILQSPTPTS